MPGFKKGSKVWLLRSYDSKGTVWARECIVDSWGARQIHLRYVESGQTLKQRFYTEQVNSNDGIDFSFTTILPHNADVQAASLKMAESFLVWERARLRRLLDRNPDADPGYVKAINAMLAEIHEPRVLLANS